jgi:hypothetical protein
VDITGYNPDVIHELGLGHVEKKLTIIFCEVSSRDQVRDLPFDFRHQYIITYTNNLKELTVRSRESLNMDFST